MRYPRVRIAGGTPLNSSPESRCEFPDALVFKNSGWVFELAD